MVHGHRRGPKLLNLLKNACKMLIRLQMGLKFQAQKLNFWSSGSKLLSPLKWYMVRDVGLDFKACVINYRKLELKDRHMCILPIF